MRFYVENFGCRATQADGAALEAQLAARRFTRANTVTAADLVVVNTCTVTAAADQQARQYVRRLHRKNPGARILLTGCYAQRAPQELAAIPGVTWVVGNSHKPAIPALVEQELNRSRRNFLPLDHLTGPAATTAGSAPEETPDLSLAAGPAKILSGNIFDCNNRCAYCVIPFVRGRSRSLPLEEVIRQVNRLSTEGYKEIVLSGVDLGSYGLDLRPRTGLPGLTERLLAETAIPLVRFSSLEPMDLTDDFLALLASSRRIARHVHTPLQSGSDRILRRMRRWSGREEYAERVEAAATALPNLGLGADVLVGFPGESEEDFRETYDLIETLPFSYLHVFSFSPRPGTAAAGMDDSVPAAAVQERSRTLRRLGAAKAARFRAQQLGKTLRVLTLHATDAAGSRQALSENYLKVRLPAGAPANELLTVRVSVLREGGLAALPVSTPAVEVLPEPSPVAAD
jgi:threonylcarbamoyladenosine tRNA methylthiotransferase MtaB